MCDRWCNVCLGGDSEEEENVKYEKNNDKDSQNKC